MDARDQEPVRFGLAALILASDQFSQDSAVVGDACGQARHIEPAPRVLDVEHQRPLRADGRDVDEFARRATGTVLDGAQQHLPVRKQQPFAVGIRHLRPQFSDVAQDPLGGQQRAVEPHGEPVGHGRQNQDPVVPGRARHGPADHRRDLAGIEGPREDRKDAGGQRGNHARLRRAPGEHDGPGAGTDLPDFVEQHEVFLDRRRGARDHHVEGLGAEAPQRVDVAGRRERSPGRAGRALPAAPQAGAPPGRSSGCGTWTPSTGLYESVASRQKPVASSQ